MRYSILGFNQDAACGISKTTTGKDGRYKILTLDVTDLLIIQELADFMNRKSVIKHTINDKMYFSIKYEKILEDLPILGIKKQALRDRIDKLCELNIVEKEVIRNETGSWTAFRLGDAYETLKYKIPVEEGVCIPLQGGVYSTTYPCVADYTPNNYTTKTNNTKEEKEYKEKVDEFVDRIYAMYPSTCPVRHTRLGKSHADKKKIKNLLKQYSREEIEKVVKQEVSEKYGKSMMQNFPTFLNHFPDPNDMFTKTGYGYPQSVADVKPDDINSTLIQFQYWLDRAAPTLCDNLRGGWPETEQQYQNMIKSTVGGARALSYVVLVFNRDGWDEYYDERGFMWTYLNYIKANGLYEG